MSCVYIIRNKINKRCYVGQTTRNYNLRLKQHIYDAKIRRYNSIFHTALRKYGIENFDVNIIKLPKDKVILDHFEKAIIKDLKEFNNHIVYNISPGGTGGKLVEVPWNKGKKCPSMSEAKLGINNPMYGKYGVLNPKATPIILIHLNGNEEKFNSLADACRKYDLHHSNLSAICNGRRKSTKGYKARYI